QRTGRHATDSGDLESREGACIETEVLEPLADRLDGVDRGEADPFVAPGDQTLDGLVHLMRRARWLDADRRDDRGTGSVGLQSSAHGDRLLLRPRHEDVPAEERLGLEPGELGP